MSGNNIYIMCVVYLVFYFFGGLVMSFHMCVIVTFYLAPDIKIITFYMDNRHLISIHRRFPFPLGVQLV